MLLVLKKDLDVLRVKEEKKDLLVVTDQNVLETEDQEEEDQT